MLEEKGLVLEEVVFVVFVGTDVPDCTPIINAIMRMSHDESVKEQDRSNSVPSSDFVIRLFIGMVMCR